MLISTLVAIVRCYQAIDKSSSSWRQAEVLRKCKQTAAKMWLVTKHSQLNFHKQESVKNLQARKMQTISAICRFISDQRQLGRFSSGANRGHFRTVQFIKQISAVAIRWRRRSLTWFAAAPNIKVVLLQHCFEFHALKTPRQVCTFLSADEWNSIKE